MKTLTQRLGIALGVAALATLGAIDARAQGAGTWTRSQTQLAQATKLASVTAVGNGNQILVIGGRNAGTSLGTVQLLTISGGRVTAVERRPVLPGELRDGGESAKCNDIALQSGGSENSGRTRQANETLAVDADGNPRNVSFLQNPMIRTFGLTVDLGGKVFVLGGEAGAQGVTRSVQSFDCSQLNLNGSGANRGALAGPRWMMEPQLLVAVARAAATSAGNRIVVTGGRAQVDSGPALNTVQILENGQFRMGPSLQQARFGHVTIALNDNQVLVAGGTDGQRALSSAEIIDLQSGQVTPAADLPMAVVFAQGDNAGMNRAIVVGGSRGIGPNDASLNEILEFSSN